MKPILKRFTSPDNSKPTTVGRAKQGQTTWSKPDNIRLENTAPNKNRPDNSKPTTVSQTTVSLVIVDQTIVDRAKQGQTTVD